MRVATPILLTDEERATLTKWAQGRSIEARLVLRAKIVLASVPNSSAMSLFAAPVASLSLGISNRMSIANDGLQERSLSHFQREVQGLIQWLGIYSEREI